MVLQTNRGWKGFISPSLDFTEESNTETQRTARGGQKRPGPAADQHVTAREEGRFRPSVCRWGKLRPELVTSLPLITLVSSSLAAGEF